MTTLARLRSMYILQRIANIKKQSSSGGDGGSGSLSGVISPPTMYPLHRPVDLERVGRLYKFI